MNETIQRILAAVLTVAFIGAALLVANWVAQRRARKMMARVEAEKAKMNSEAKKEAAQEKKADKEEKEVKEKEY